MYSCILIMTKKYMVQCDDQTWVLPKMLKKTEMLNGKNFLLESFKIFLKQYPPHFPSLFFSQIKKLNSRSQTILAFPFYGLTGHKGMCVCAAAGQSQINQRDVKLFSSEKEIS